VFTVSLLVHIRQGVCILLDYGNETHFFAGSALSSFGRPDPPATSQSDGRAGSMCLLFHGSNRRASAQDFPASCLLEEGGHRRGQARGQVDALQARRSIQPACRFNSEECARGPEARYGATARPTAPQPRLLRSQESGSVAWSAGAIFARVRGSSGVGNGNRTRNRRSHSPVLCQLSYSHRLPDYNNCAPPTSETHSRLHFISPKSGHRRQGGPTGCPSSLGRLPPLAHERLVILSPASPTAAESTTRRIRAIVYIVTDRRVGGAGAL
jgi:hypothetical protein